jgi:predicted dehydrogenase
LLNSISIAGTGLSGLTFHVPFILALPELFILHSVLERNPQPPHGKVHKRFGVSVKIHKTIEDVLADAEIELVVVGTPNDTHYAFAKAALESGKHGAHHWSILFLVLADIEGNRKSW